MCLSINHCVCVNVILALLTLQVRLIFPFCENVQRLKIKLKEMSSSQEDLSKMSVKVINLPFVIVFAKLYQSHKKSSLSLEKKNSKSNNNNDNNNNNISCLKLVSNPWLSLLAFTFSIILVCYAALLIFYCGCKAAVDDPACRDSYQIVVYNTKMGQITIKMKLLCLLL